MGSAISRWTAKFVDELASVPSTRSFLNFYSTDRPTNSVRCHNLALYFEDLYEYRPEILLVGEAPGYRGTKVTGVPFADVPIVMGGVRNLGLFGQMNGYRPPVEDDHPPFERTSTVMWKVLARHNFRPLLWAAFPFHPHGDAQESNRTPTAAELTLGRTFLQKILTDWRIRQVVAVGRAAERTLGTLEVPCNHVRHPARGGERQFATGIERLVGDTHCGNSRLGGVGP